MDEYMCWLNESVLEEIAPIQQPEDDSDNIIDEYDDVLGE